MKSDLVARLTGARSRRVFVNLAGNGVYAIGQALILVVLAHSRGAAGVGQYAFALAIAAPVFQFADLKLRMVVATDHGRSVSDERYTGLRLLTTLTAATATSVFGVAALSSEDASVLAAVCAYKAVESTVDILCGLLQRESRFIEIATSQVSRTVLGTLTISLVLTLGASISVAVLSGAAMTLPTLVWLVHRLKQTGHNVRPDVRHVRKHMRVAGSYVPLGVSVAIGSLITNVPRYALKAFVGDEAVGVYSVLVYALVISGMLAQSIAETTLPKLSLSFSQGDRIAFGREIRRLTLGGAAIGATGLILALGFGGPALQILLGPEFAAHHVALTLLMAAAAVQYVGLSFGVGLTSMRAFSVELPANAAGLIAAIGASILLAPYGVMGSATALLVARSTISTLYFIFYRRQLARTRLGVNQ